MLQINFYPESNKEEYIKAAEDYKDIWEKDGQKISKLIEKYSGLIFKTLDSSYRRIFQLPSRHLLLGQAVYITMSIFVILLFFVLNFIWIIFSSALPPLLDMINTTTYFTSAVETIKLCLTYQPVNLLSVAIILAFYLTTVKLFLNIKIIFRYQLLSGVIFCLLWMVARQIFSVYIQHVSEVNIVYGSLSSVIVILMWVFYSSMALLFSIEVMFVLHSGNWRYRWF